MLQQAIETSVLDELWYQKPIRQHVREFAALFALIGFCAAFYVAYKDGSLATTFAFSMVSLALISLGYQAPQILYPVWNAWMTLAEKMGVVMTFIILMLAWSLMLIPIALLLRVIRIRVMDTSFRAPVETYWEDREEKLHDFQLLRRQF